MNRHAHFAYAQARLQARHGRRPDVLTWQQLGAISDVAHYLQTARRTALRPWVMTLTSHTEVRDVERVLHQHFRAYVEETAHWQPRPWWPAVRWVKQLLDVPALQHLLAGEATPDWMRSDPALRAFTSENLNVRMAALQSSECAPLVNAWRRGVAPREAWLIHWRSLWPGTSTPMRTALEALVSLFELHLAQLTTARLSAPAREDLEIALTRQFRRHTHQPATTFVSLALMALDVERLRGQLLRRMLFVEPSP